MDSKRSVFIRVPLLGAIGYGLWVVVGTASRGALLGIIAAFLFIMWRSTMRQRIVTVLVGLVFGVVILAALPQMTASRLSSLFGEKNVEADESATTRSHLFRQSLLYTVQHPLFGVGPDQFINYQGDEHDVRLWHGTHCAWTQVSSECGIPALIFFALGMGSAIWAVARTYRAALARGYGGIANACFCYLLAMVGYTISISFLSNAYTPAIPLVVGLGVAIAAAGAKEMAKAAPAPLFPAPVRA
jgi:O-antigen ligase